MSNPPQEDTKLIIIPSHLVDRLKAIANRQSVSLSAFAAESLEQVLRAHEMDVSLREVVDVYRLTQIQRGAGMVDIPRSSLNHLVEKLYPKKSEELKRVWSEAGRWYGEYLRTKLEAGEMLRFFEKDLLLTWNLDEVEIHEMDVDVNLRWVSFMMTTELTELLLSYVKGVMQALEYREVDRDYLRGMATLKYIKMRNK